MPEILEFPEFIHFEGEKEIDAFEFIFNGNIIFVDEPGSGVMTINSESEL